MLGFVSQNGRSYILFITLQYYSYSFIRVVCVLLRCVCRPDLKLNSLLQVLVCLLDQLFGAQDPIPHHVFGAATAEDPKIISVN